MFSKVLIANRGEIACRIIRTLDRLGVASVAVYSEADRDAPHVSLAGEAVCLGPAPVAESYLRMDRILAAARETGAGAIHPGYGLLSENAGFAEECQRAGIVFIGPRIEQLVAFGLKHEARRLVEESRGPLLPGTGLLDNPRSATLEAERVGYPVMLKSTAGGGGIGMQVCQNGEELESAYARVERLSRNHFGQGGIFLEKFIPNARHLEVQVFGDGEGRVVTLGVRDCSAQRRNQKVIEETPPANVPDAVLSGMQDAARRLTAAIRYRSAGTVEFIYDTDSQAYYFLEVNTRLQVEHGVTELVTGVDLVEWMVRLAAGEDVLTGLPDELPRQGHSIQARLYAENPYKDFQPSSGLLTRVEFPGNVRMDSWIGPGTEVSPYYDPLLAKLLVCRPNREEAVEALNTALEQSSIDGIESNLDYLRSVANSEVFRSGNMLTRSLRAHPYHPRSLEILRSGTMTTIQDHPGRTGYWDVGVPPSGPMDALSFRLGNRMLGNAPDAAGIEITATGPAIEFHCATTAVLTGAEMAASLSGRAVPFYSLLSIKPGDRLDIGKIRGHGVRAYLCLAGGIEVPPYLGSRSTFTLGQFGGHGGRALRPGDVLHLGEAQPGSGPTTLPADQQPAIGGSWELGVLYGPHGAPDYFTPEDMETFFATEWEVHYNSARTGVRLVGPRPKWARQDGGEAGLHPSNIHDNAYAVGAVDFTGDMPVILGPDGPSLGGFVCPVTVVQAELWKLGQLRPGDRVRFRCLSRDVAASRLLTQEEFINNLVKAGEAPLPHHHPEPAEALLAEEGTGAGRLVIRQAGDAYVLAEIGDMKLDFELRFHIHVLYEALVEADLEGVMDLTPGIRSLQVHFDSSLLDARGVSNWIVEANRRLPPLEDLTVPSRIVHLPLSWDDPATREAIRKYMQSVRPDAPWCPDNIEFIRRINGLDSLQEVYDIVFNARYVVLGLGDVYLGAPVATPLDPRHRLVTTKYNPARTWTPENAVGIGGAYLCIYGMEGPGGYQFVGRTVQMWNRYRTTRSFQPEHPWLLRFFDQVHFYPVTTEELRELRRDFPLGRFNPHMEETEFSLGAYQQFLRDNAGSIQSFKQRQQQAFEEERLRWEAAGLAAYDEGDAGIREDRNESLPEGMTGLESPVAGSLWKIVLNPGQSVREGETVAIVESMKMEIAVESPCSGKLARILCREGQAVSPGQVLFAIEGD